MERNRDESKKEEKKARVTIMRERKWKKRERIKERKQWMKKWGREIMKKTKN